MNGSGREPEFHVEGRRATITLRRPQVANRLEPEDIDRLRTHIAEVDARPEVLVLRLTSEGQHFCSGFNIGALGGEDAGKRFESLAGALEAARPITIAVLQGGAYGGATDLALACDFRFGSPASEILVPAARLGVLFYRGGLERYVSRLGLGTAKRVMLAADKLDAREMLACGFLDRLAPSADELSKMVEEVTQRLAGMAPLALLGMKKHLNRIARGTLDEAAFAQDIAASDASEDLKEGMLAWQQKRPPVFKG
jgi:enoyl-CoA hydratase/carnithine racemase